MRKLLSLLLLVPMLAVAQSYTTFPNLRSGNMDFTATIRANGSACASGTAIVSGGGSVTCVAVIPSSEKGANSGVATLDSGGKVPTAQLPFSGLTYDGSWNANTNSPTLADGVGTSGHFYITSVAGSQNLGSGSITFAVGDWALYNGTVWQKVPSSAAVTSVFGRTGAVTATAGDYTATQVTNTPAGGISATTAQAAINELDTEKQAAASTLTSWAALTRASGFDTFTQTPSSANLRGLLTDETGTGLAYFQGGALGTPASGTLTSATGLPWSTGLTGVPTTAVGYGITGGAKLDAYAGGDTPSAFTLGIVDSVDAATWRAALGAGTSSTTGTVTSVSGSGGSTGLTLTGGPITTSGTLTLGGTLADGSLSSNVALKNFGNVFTVPQVVSTSASNYQIDLADANGVTYELGTTAGYPQLGTSSSHALGFYTSNTTRGVIGTTGNWTINAPSSGPTLSVTGINATNTMQLTDGTEILYWLTDASHNWRQGINGSHALSLFTANTDRLSISAAGNVTVAAPSSGAALTLNGVGGTDIAVFNGANQGLKINSTALTVPVKFVPTGGDAWTVQAGVLAASDFGFINVTDGTYPLLISGTGGVTFLSPTGGDKGPGTLNTAGGIYQNNVAVALSDGSNLTALPAISGANLTTLNASNISSGTLNNSRLPATINAATDVQVGGVSMCRSNGTNCPGGTGASIYGVVPTGQGGSCAVDTSYNNAGISSCGDATAGHVSVNFTSTLAKKPVCVATAASLTSTAETVTITSISTSGVSFWLFVSSTGALINGSVSFTCT